MHIRTGSARWLGTLRDGSGEVRFGSGENAYAGPYGFSSRFESGEGTNPEELLGAAHAGCFSMALSADLGRAGFEPKSIETTAQVHFDKVDDRWTVTGIHLVTVGDVPGISAEAFEAQAQGAKENCPISRALGAIDLSVEATLAQ